MTSFDRVQASCRRYAVWTMFLATAVFIMPGLMCEPEPFSGGDPNVPAAPLYANTTDRTNGGAEFLGASACAACHAELAAAQAIHGHGHKLKKIQGFPPTYPAEGTAADVPNPPAGFTWSDISYVIGGYTKKARFIDQDGYILTTGVLGIPVQWNLDFPANGTVPGFVNYEPAAVSPKPYDYSCFVCHTTGPLPQNAGNPFFQDNRPGLAGTWEEPGIQCEACHGPGGNHAPDPQARAMFVDTAGGFTCRECHHRPFQSANDEIIADKGYINHHEQWPELKASGGHKDFSCTVCHDPHRSVIYDRANALRNTCTDCHAGHNMALHEGAVFVRGDYSETLSCESCHMPFATRSASNATTAVVGAVGRMGDTRTHIFRINLEPVDYTSFFSSDGKTVVRDAEGRAAVTVDFVCLRCHNGIGNVFSLTTERAAEIAQNVHKVFE